MILHTKRHKIIGITNIIFGKDLVSIDYNVSRLCAGGALKHESFNPPLNLNRITND